MSLFGTFTVGKQGLLAHQRAVQVTSNNIANVNTPGYSRQRPVLEPIVARPLAGGLQTTGGVELARVERLADEFLDAQLRRERQEFAQDEALSAGLTRLDAIFQELNGNGIDAAVSRLFASLNDLANEPSDPTVRASVVESATALANLLNDTDRRLAQVQIDENGTVEQLATDITQLAAEIAEVNGRIFLHEAGGEPAAALRDRRGALLEQLAQKIDITAFEHDDGTMAVYVAGGFLLVDGNAAASLEVRTGAGPNGSLFDVYQSLDGSIAGPITSRISGGQLGAAIALRDDRVPLYRAKLDEFAYTLATRLNEVHLAGSGTVDGNARRLFVDARGVPSIAGADFAAIAGAAGMIAVHADLLADASHVAAGTPVSGPAASGDNRNALALAAVQSATAPVYQITSPPPDVAGGPPSGPLRTLGDMYGALLGGLGAEIQATERRAAQGELILGEIEDRRAALSGVSIDEEVANLIRFEKGYQASARIISTIDDMLEQLLSI